LKIQFSGIRFSKVSFLKTLPRTLMRNARTTNEDSGREL
jgi:hypothetical protein